MANYINKLQDEVARLESERAEALAALDELRVYLSSPKFYVDTTVQVGDVARRIEPVRMALLNL